MNFKKIKSDFQNHLREINKKELGNIWFLVVIIALIIPFHLPDNWQLLGFFVPMVLLFTYSYLWKKANYDVIVAEAKSRGKYAINHIKRINSWCAYFFTIGTVNLLVIFGIGFFMERPNPGLVIGIPTLIFLGLTYLLFRAKTETMAKIFFVYYLLMFALGVNILLFLFGFTGVVQCYYSSRELSRKNT